jgi:hypothetical protein
MNVPFVFSSNGHLFVEFDRLTGLTAAPKPLTPFPAPAELQARYEHYVGFSLADPAARPLLARYVGGEATRRYYQDAAAISADNLRYFGDPVYEYDMAQGIEDGYLAACEIQKGRVNLDDTGITIEDILARNPVDATTGRPITAAELKERYEKTEYEDRILLPDRVLAMCRDLFKYLLETGGPEQKTIIFCARDRHAEDVAGTLNNLYAQWCAQTGKARLEPYAFKRLAARLIQEAPTLEAFRSRWIAPRDRQEMLGPLPEAGRSAILVRDLEDMQNYDLYDVLAELGYGLAPRTRVGRAGAFTYKHKGWLDSIPVQAVLKALGKPREVLMETKSHNLRPPV